MKIIAFILIGQLNLEVQTKAKMEFIKAQKRRDTAGIASFCNAEKFHFCHVSDPRFSWHINNTDRHKKEVGNEHFCCKS